MIVALLAKVRRPWFTKFLIHFFIKAKVNETLSRFFSAQISCGLFHCVTSELFFCIEKTAFSDSLWGLIWLWNYISILLKGCQNDYNIKFFITVTSKGQYSQITIIIIVNFVGHFSFFPRTNIIQQSQYNNSSQKIFFFKVLVDPHTLLFCWNKMTSSAARCNHKWGAFLL